MSLAAFTTIARTTGYHWEVWGMASKLLALALCLCLCMLSACAPITMSTENLLEPPKLNQRQTKVEEALDATLDLSAILYRYPQSGDFSSPFVFYDLDKDEREEAVVFYAFRNDPESIRAKVLKEREDGSWQVVYDLSGRGEDQVDFIQFAHVLSLEQECMLIGWQNTRTGLSSLEAFSFGSGEFRREIQISYNLICVDDFLDNGLSEIALVQLDSDDFYQAVLLGRSPDGRLTPLGDAPLAIDVNTVLQLQKGKLWSSNYALYIDELLIDSKVATEIIQVTRSGLRNMVGEETPELFLETQRSEEILSVDLHGDGFIELPTLTELPGYTADSGIAPPPLVEYIRMTASGVFELAYTAVTNTDAGYLVFFPERWRSTVMVERRPESNEWYFYKVDPTTNLRSTELLRIYVYTMGNYRDRNTYDYTPLAERGRFQYYAYIPRTYGEPLAITEEELSRMFLLL